MPYRQPWEIGHQRAQALRDAAGLERVRREARAEGPNGLRIAAAGLARAAARLVLRARGLDPFGLAAPEPALATDRLGYHEEVASTLRRRDLSIWLERWGEAVTAGLRRAARAFGMLVDEVPDRAAAFVAGHPDPTFTVADYRAVGEVGPAGARADLQALLDAGRTERVPGARGLRYAIHAR